jgi:hypothetical protein
VKTIDVGGAWPVPHHERRGETERPHGRVVRIEDGADRGSGILGKTASIERDNAWAHGAQSSAVKRQLHLDRESRCGLEAIIDRVDGSRSPVGGGRGCGRCRGHDGLGGGYRGEVGAVELDGLRRHIRKAISVIGLQAERLGLRSGAVDGDRRGARDELERHRRSRFTAAHNSAVAGQRDHEGRILVQDRG